MLKRLMLLSLILYVAIVTGCNDDDDATSSASTTTPSTSTTTPSTPSTSSQISPQQQVLSTSLHSTTAGMKYFYAKEQGGFETFTHVPYEKLGACQTCHVEPSKCETCHQKTGDKPTNAACLKCHNKQQTEQKFAPDFHLLEKTKGGLGMQCADCHTAQQVHGDGKQYNTMFEKPTKVNCQQSNCHTKLNQDKPMHKQHHDDLDCAACHVKVTPTCYNCHFSEQKGFDEFKFYPQPIGDWKILVKDAHSGKVTSGNIQNFTSFQGNALLTVVPYFSHTIQKTSDTTCGECHNSPALNEYKDTGTMTLTTWDETSKQLKNMPGVIPIPLDWETALRLVYLNQDASGQWIYQGKNAADANQMLYAKPIDVGSMPKF